MTRQLFADGRLICVVGPSGAGKDAIMRGVMDMMPEVKLARRVITRPKHDASEEFDSVSPDEFRAMRDSGDFLFHWQAHGLSYAVPACYADVVAAGDIVLFNGSRAALPEMRQICPDMRVFLITVSADILALRLASRGRETRDEIRQRLSRTVTVPVGDAVHINNDGPLADAVAQFVARLRRPEADGE